MGMEPSGLMVVRADLCDRLEMVRALAGRASAEDMERSVGAVRTIASAYGLTPVARLADALERAIRGGASGSGETALYIDRLYDAIGCRRVDDAASEAMLASVSVRLHG